MKIQTKISLILSGVVLIAGIFAAFITSKSMLTQANVEIIVDLQMGIVESGTEAAYHVQRIKSNIREVVLEHLANLLEEEREEAGVFNENA